jgi:hypothetical protein
MQTQAIYYICTQIYKEHVHKVGQVQKTKGGGKEGKKDSEQ